MVDGIDLVIFVRVSYSIQLQLNLRLYFFGLERDVNRVWAMSANG